MNTRDIALKAAFCGAALISIPAQARVLYAVNVASGGRIVVKVDTHGLPANGRIPQANLSLVLKDSGGHVLAPARLYSITQWTGPLVARQIYEVRYPTNLANARYAIVTGAVAWGVEASGDKADGQPSEAEVLQSAVPTVSKGQGTVVPPPPSPDTVTRCGNYARTAVAQQTLNTSRQCGLRGSRWSGVFAYHYRWCLGVGMDASRAETNARGAALASCSQH